MNEQEIRAIAHARNDKGRHPTIRSADKWYLTDPKKRRKRDDRSSTDVLLRDRVAEYIDNIPIEDPSKLSMCPTCEGVLCGLCGKCHDLDNRNPYRHERACPAVHYMHHGDLCITWATAYDFLRDAGKQTIWKHKVVWVRNEFEQHQAYNAPGSPLVVCYKEAGWELKAYEDHHPGYAHCADPHCDAIPVWCSMCKAPGYLVRNYYCDQHLEPDLRPQAQEK
jgi:hypothetical protein